jgi:copper transport protein
VPSRPVPFRRAVRWLLVGLGLLAVAGPLAGVAGAHATLISSDPGNDEVVADAPQQVVLTFDDGVVVDDDGVTVLDPRGNDVADGSPESSGDGREVRQRIDPVAKGTYTVSYRVLSDDGHVIDGSYVFHYGERTGSSAATTGSQADPLRVLNAFGRWLGLSGALLVGGVLAMAWFVDRRDGDRDGDGVDVTDGDDAGALAGLAAVRFLLVPGAVTVLFGVALSLLASAADLAGGSLADGPGNVGRFVTASWSGSVAGLRVLVALVLVLAVGGPVLLRKVPWLAALCALAALVLPSLGGHAWTASPEWLAVASDALHVLAAAAWVGGLGVLVLTWDGSRDRAAAFSRMAIVAAPLTIATGLLNTWLQERSLSAVTDTTHGWLVLAKLLGALAMVAFGWVHRRQIADAARWTARRVVSYRVEAVVGVAVIAVTAVLVGTPPGREARPDAEPVQLVRQAGDTTVRMQVFPAAAGPNDVHLYYLARDGSLASVDAAELEISTDGVAPRKVPITPVTANHGYATGVSLTPGTWRFELTIVSAGVPARTTFEVPIA